MPIHFVDLNRQYLSIRDDIDAAIRGVIDRSAFILGEEMERFEKSFADFCGVKHCISVSSGTDALHLSLRALGVGPGDEVITVANTYISTAMAASYCGAKPVLVDCGDDYTIDIGKLKAAITDRTKVIIPVHLYGQPADMQPILELARKRNIKVVEDACQAHGAEHNGKKVGSLGEIGCFSFYPGKNLGAYGDGGAITTNDGELAERLKLLRNYGQKKRYYHSILGYNSRLDNLQAAVLNVKLRHLGKWNESRRKNALLYDELFQGVDGVIVPFERKDVKHVYHLYVIRISPRDNLWKRLMSLGIECGVHYPVPIHLQDAYSGLGYSKGSFPVTEEFSDTILSLPMFPELEEEEISRVVEEIKKFFSR